MSTQPNPQKQQEVIARNVFNKFDEDGSCAISTAEFRRLIEFLGADFRDSEVADAIKEIDQDGSGQIDREEFVRWWTNQSSTREAGGVVAIKLRKLANRAMYDTDDSTEYYFFRLQSRFTFSRQVFNTDIHTAVWNNDLALVKMFLGIDPKKMSNLADMSEYGDHMTPLHYASYQGNKEIVLELLRCNANVNVKNRFGFTPLFYASQRGFIEVCRALVEAGADPTLIGFDEDYPQFALCPADHVVDYPELESIFRRNQNCKEPETPSIGEISLTISTTGAAVLTLPPLIAISKLLVQSYSLTLFTSMTDQLPEEILAKTIPVSVDLEDPDRKIKDKRFMPETIDFKYEKKEQEMIVDALRRSENIVFNVVVTNALGNGLSTEHKAVKILRSASQQLATKSVSSETKSIASQSSKSVVSSRRVPT